MQNFRQWLFENEEESPVLLTLIYIGCSSQGVHAWNNEDDSAADDPKLESVEWNWGMDDGEEAIAEPLLKGHPVKIIENEMHGSFHEKWQEINVYVIVPKPVHDRLQDAHISMYVWDGVFKKHSRDVPSLDAKVIGQFPFLSKQDTISKVMELCMVKGPKGELPGPAAALKPEPFSDEWWNEKRRRNTGDMGPGTPFGRDWDGD